MHDNQTQHFTANATAIQSSMTFDDWSLENNAAFNKLSSFEQEDVKSYFRVYSLFYASIKNTIKLISTLDVDSNQVLLADLCHQIALRYKHDLPVDIDLCSEIFVTSQTSILAALQKESIKGTDE